MKFSTLLMLGTASVGFTGIANAQTSPADSEVAAQSDAASPNSDDIIVTARRKSESIQRVPVSIQAFSPEAIQKQVVLSTTDLARITPGVVFSGAGNGTLNTTFTIRGQGRDVIGPIAPSVMSYFNDVPLPNWGAVLPTYDVANVQVLKGPQGTLFGRNTTGGAVLVNSQQPTYNVEGYFSGLYGSYRWKELEGALNVPILDEHIALRLAGRYAKRDGYTTSPQGFGRGDDLNDRQFRLSLLLEPVDGLKNVTVYDYSNSDQVGAVLHPTGFAAGLGGAGAPFATFRFFPGLFDCGTSASCDFDLALARSLANPRNYYSGMNQVGGNGAPFIHATIEGIANTTTLDLGEVSIKNIFGYRRARIRMNSEGDGTEARGVDSYVYRSEDQISDELQFSGSLFDGKTQWLLGAFYLNNTPKGPNGIQQDLFGGLFSSTGTTQVKEWTKAVFGSISQEVVPGLKFNASGRYTWDSVKSCSFTGPFTTPPFGSFKSCTAGVGTSVESAKFRKFTWSVGLDYQASDRIFLYAVTRRGYRAGGINTPTFGGIFTPFQTFGPQTVTDGEIGIKAEWSVGSVRGRTNLAGYISHFKNVQLGTAGLSPGADGDGNPATDPSNTSFNFNGGTAKTHGIDLDGYVSPFEGLRLTYGLALFHGKIKNGAPPALVAFLPTDDQFDNAPKTSYTLGLAYSPNVDVLGGTLNFNIDFYKQGSYKSHFYIFPSHTQTNASIGVDNIGQTGLDAQIFVQNLTDELYPTNALLSGQSPGLLTATYSPPRMFGVRLRYNFGAN